MDLRPELSDLLDQFFFRMLDMDLVDAFGGFCSCCASLAWLSAVALVVISQNPALALRQTT